MVEGSAFRFIYTDKRRSPKIEFLCLQTFFGVRGGWIVPAAVW